MYEKSSIQVKLGWGDRQLILRYREHNILGDRNILHQVTQIQTWNRTKVTSTDRCKLFTHCDRLTLWDKSDIKDAPSKCRMVPGKSALAQLLAGEQGQGWHHRKGMAYGWEVKIYDLPGDGSWLQRERTALSLAGPALVSPWHTQGEHIGTRWGGLV